MKLQLHPEYPKYLQDRETVQRCQRAVAAWRADGETIPAIKYEISWTYERAYGFVRSLVGLFQAYNRVLWEQFPYCSICGGGCCVLDASHVGAFDGIAMALLGLPLPDLADAIATSARGCVYLDGQQCALPAQWRTIKCWSFYCLGGRWEPGASLGEYHSALAGALKGIVLDLLPEELRRYERVRGDRLVDHLDDPTDFAHALEDALYELLVSALQARYPLPDEGLAGGSVEREEAPSVEEDVLAFVAQATEQLFGLGPSAHTDSLVSSEQLLADLELLEWIVVGHPSNRVPLLEEMHARYAGLPAPDGGSDSAVEYRMLACIARMLKDHDQ